MLLELNGAAWFMEKEALSLQVRLSHMLCDPMFDTSKRAVAFLP
jgi:hypothetical protein